MTDPKGIPASPQSDLAARYGTDRPRGRRTLLVLAAVVGAALVTWVLWAGWFHGEPSIEADVTAYEVVSTHEARVKVSLQVEEGLTGGCLLRATATDHSIVGERNLTFAELEEAEGSWIPLRTERRATTVTLVRCTESG